MVFPPFPDPRSAAALLRPSGGTVARTAAGTLSRCHDPDPERASGKSRRQTFSDAGRFPELMVHACMTAILEPIREVGIQAERLGCVRRRSIMRIMASLTKAATVRE